MILKYESKIAQQKQKNVNSKAIINLSTQTNSFYKLLKELGLIKDSFDLIFQIYNDYKLLQKQELIAKCNKEIEEFAL
ncbi:43921_t:CDS:2 [Gigaspora margarita]|uniref:43921_t:CDS:1 n=1 Tax=Gigaspora margarita TaxID=4874 RepID=A0ABN7V418_GIGMA|nr:43921_t:CDS:2 [Gigaspora margarita]